MYIYIYTYVLQFSGQIMAPLLPQVYHILSIFLSFYLPSIFQFLYLSIYLFICPCICRHIYTILLYTCPRLRVNTVLGKRCVSAPRKPRKMMRRMDRPRRSASLEVKTVYCLDQGTAAARLSPCSKARCKGSGMEGNSVSMSTIYSVVHKCSIP